MTSMNIWIAASDNNLEYVKQVIESGKHTANDKDANGYTPLHAAASYGYIDLLNYLLNEGKGDVNITDNEGDSLLHVVEDVATAKLLVEKYNANWKHKNDEGLTPLGKMEEDEEFPELIAYYRSLIGSSVIPDKNNNTEGQSTTVDAVSVLDELYKNPNVKFSFENEDAVTGDSSSSLAPLIDADQRKEIETIINGENAEEELQKYMQKIIEKSIRSGRSEQDSNERSIKKKRASDN